MSLSSIKPLRGEVTVPGDKSISHRAVMFGALSKGKTRITGFLKGADCLSTISCFRQMGIDIEDTGSEILLQGRGLHGLKAPSDLLYTGNSGTTTRLLSGILAGQSFESRISGDASICKRPMGRVIDPLTQMGASIESEGGNGCTPLHITPSALKGITYNSPVASAQVKSAILLAGLYAEGSTTVIEPALSRDHTERMLRSLGATVKSEGNSATLIPENELNAVDFEVPGDISSATYFIAAALLVPGSEVLIRNVGINPTRAGILEVAEKMGGNIEYLNRRGGEGEPVADLLVRSSLLKGTTVEGDLIPTLIDELPMIAVMAAMAEGTTVVKDAAELKVKESDRIMTVTENLKKMGADITPTENGYIINGTGSLTGAALDSYLDHRIAMSFTVASLVAEGETTIKNKECVDISYPGFYGDLESLMR
ncbi:MAG: 3-phosphoshikimate 1-carboxyvinyltransferase [Lachnospiraceae bacterium]|nr:3-phosphoshikimate 1-carboxyvinyltransferase [Lachnospiraceae bacterium]